MCKLESLCVRGSIRTNPLAAAKGDNTTMRPVVRIFLPVLGLHIILPRTARNFQNSHFAWSCVFNVYLHSLLRGRNDRFNTKNSTDNQQGTLSILWRELLTFELNLDKVSLNRHARRLGYRQRWNRVTGQHFGPGRVGSRVSVRYT